MEIPQHLRTLTCALAVLATATLSAPAFAHGGAYRGPTDPVTPRAVARPTGPVIPPNAPQADPRHLLDLTTWRYWWEFHRHSYLGLRRPQAKRTLLPTITQVHEDVLPALKRVLDSTSQKDIVSSCLIAMAKTGQDHADFKLADVFTPRLSSKTQQIRETAALAMGIAGVDSEKALVNLIALACDTDAGRRLTGGPVRPRTRTFALYGLGIYANEQSSLETKRRALTAMQTVFEDASRNRNVTIAAIQAIGLLAFDRSNPKHAPLLDEALDTLLAAYAKKGKAGTWLVQSHCAGALVQLSGIDHARSPSIRRLFAAELDRKKKSLRMRDLARSAVLGLGKMCAPNESKTSVDREYSELLMDTFRNHKDAQTRYFSLIALGQIGGT